MLSPSLTLYQMRDNLNLSAITFSTQSRRCMNLAIGQWLAGIPTISSPLHQRHFATKVILLCLASMKLSALCGGGSLSITQDASSKRWSLICLQASCYSRLTPLSWPIGPQEDGLKDRLRLAIMLVIGSSPHRVRR